MAHRAFYVRFDKQDFFFFFSCSMQVLVTRPRVEPRPPALGMWSLASFLISPIPNFYLTELLGKLTGLTGAKCPHPGWQ